MIDQRLIRRVHPHQCIGDLDIDVINRSANIVAAQALAAVAQVKRFAAAGGRAGRRDRATDGATGQMNFRFHRRTAAGIPDASA